MGLYLALVLVVFLLQIWAHVLTWDSAPSAKEFTSMLVLALIPVINLVVLAASLVGLYLSVADEIR